MSIAIDKAYTKYMDLWNQVHIKYTSMGEID